MNKLISLIEIIYIYFMYNIFKTSYSIHHPFEILLNRISLPNFLKHPIYSNIYESKICPFGKFASILLIIWLIIRIKFNKMNYFNLIKYIFFPLFFYMMICICILV